MIPKGTEVLCPDCKELVGTLICDVFAYQRIRCEQFKFNTKYKPFNIHEKIISRCCKVMFIGTRGTYTKDGWILAHS